ncbi:MAG: hypothetical protein AUK47_03810 [Deltaproteobacteria bacterium CG2_30_63_29]|nr:MAG: hypothetical protein AUK47_03810 [Deltaproteobacteria bacterium CG2_30_63_29]PJB37373.1 MAG: hypothetical protein CO108_21290 [Deltaproteobacteria bacterium CG_4_9_14_3_um_filter_63_12]
MFTRRPVVFSLLLSALLLSACDDGTTTAEDTHLVDDAETSDTTGASDTNALPDSVSPDGTDATPLQDTDAADVETPPNCGDGVLNAGEFCDDGNFTAGDGCDLKCVVEQGWACPSGESCFVPCGDGMVGPGEACDDHNTDANDGCSATCDAIEAGYNCPAPGLRCEPCGDGNLDAHEACDDGNAVGGDGCAASCGAIEANYTCPSLGVLCDLCGDRAQGLAEGCDDGNRTEGDGCTEACELEPGAVCPSPGYACVAERCGDTLVAAQETCDDGARLSGDGCSFACQVEAGWVCPNDGNPCRAAVCGDGVVESTETCDDGGTTSGDGCDATCKLEPGFYCPVPNSPCAATVCGDGLLRGLEQCDDGNSAPADGCTNCTLDPGSVCPIPSTLCRHTTCGDGLVEGTERCDDGNTAPDDGCAAACSIEPLYECSGAPSRCRKAVEFVEVVTFPVPMAANEAIHYDPITRTFTVYDFSAGDGIEFCTDGTVVGTRSRHGIGGALDGSTYDPFNDRFLFVQQNNTLTEVDRAGQVVRQVALTGTNMAAGISVGEDGRLYVADNTSGVGVPKHVRVFERWSTAPVATWVINVDGPYLDQMVTLPGTGWVAMYNRPAGEVDRFLRVFDMQGNVVGQSTIPGLLFTSPNGASIGLSDGAEAAVDGASFMLCSAYKTGNPDSPGGAGICVIFARTCETHADCAGRIPQTACKLDEPIPYCYAPGAARDDRYSVAGSSAGTSLDVGRNDLGSDQSCVATPPAVVAVSAGDQGGTIAVGADGTSVDYTPAPGFCDGTETFTYDSDLGGVTGIQTATVEVFVTCTCGDGHVGATEACDDGNLTDGDGCNATCVPTVGWLCDNSSGTSVCTFIN